MLAQLLAEGSPQQRWGATVALCQKSADLRSFLPTMARQLAEPDVRLVDASLAALARLEADSAPALQALRALLRHEDAEIRRAALVTLGAIGPAADDAVLDITAFLGDVSAELRLAAADAMRRIRPSAPIEASQLAAHLDWLRTEVPALMREHHVPGVSVAIIEHGELRWSQGFGVADARTGKAVTAETVFEAASMSKPIVALVAVQLVQEGRLDLDRPLVGYLGRDYLPDQPAHRRITARMALTHRTGFENWRPGYDEMGGPLALNFPPGPSTRTRAKGSCSCSARSRRSPGSRSSAWRRSGSSRRCVSRARASCGPKLSSRSWRAATARTAASRSERGTARRTARIRFTRRPPKTRA
jgi:hypothetical protein